MQPTQSELNDFLEALGKHSEPKKPTSQARIDANRANALKSTGPRTPEGKARVSLNALRHGLTGRVSVMNEADREAHDRHMAAHLESFNPETPLERDLAEAIAEDLWRLKNARAIDQNILANAQAELELDGTLPTQIATALADAETFLNEAPKFQLLTLYQQRIERSMNNNLKLLQAQQSERKAARETAFAEAQTLALLDYAEGKPCTSETETTQPNGFVFSTTEINQAIARNRRLKDARNAESHSWDPKKVSMPHAA